MTLENDRLNYILSCKCEEVEAWKSKCEHLEQHLTDYRIHENKTSDLERKVEYLL